MSKSWMGHIADYAKRGDANKTLREALAEMGFAVSAGDTESTVYIGYAEVSNWERLEESFKTERKETIERVVLALRAALTPKVQAFLDHLTALTVLSDIKIWGAGDARGDVGKERPVLEGLAWSEQLGHYTIAVDVA